MMAGAICPQHDTTRTRKTEPSAACPMRGDHRTGAAGRGLYTKSEASERPLNESMGILLAANPYGQKRRLV